MHRFFVKNKENDFFILDNEIMQHIKSARLEKDHFLCNYEGSFYECILEDKKAKILNKLEIDHEYRKQVILAVPIIKIKRYEWILQKATELGVTKIIPMNTKFTDQTIVKYDLAKKVDRFKEIIKNAAEQSFRNIIPEYTDIMTLEEILKTYQNFNLYFAYENTNAENQITHLQTNSVILVGPEGGFSKEEVELANQYACKIVSLGKTILRAETACLYMLSNIRE
ncbi:16S rRNA (uracil(1498)-N(3))-methyltransferase [Mycoplasmopsis felifaucium]|uniref:Ribosomal RNA small subunit methyltransferase E n=1 Tax=Mycoplasmopsis felifaucium TaxID=35768 RepID=A0ABZ2RTB7_9BACT